MQFPSIKIAFFKIKINIAFPPKIAVEFVVLSIGYTLIVYIVAIFYSLMRNKNNNLARKSELSRFNEPARLIRLTVL